MHEDTSKTSALPPNPKHSKNIDEMAERIASSFVATIAHLQETARLEREAGIVIGEKRGFARGEEERQKHDAEANLRLNEAQHKLAESKRLIDQRNSELQRLRDRDLIAQKLAAIENGTMWKATYPLRMLGDRFPNVRHLARRTAKLVWWIVTGQLRSKLKARRNYLEQLNLAEERSLLIGENPRTEPLHGPTKALVEIQENEYERWIREHDTLSAEDVALIRLDIARLTNPPVISVVMPVYNPPAEFLQAAIESVRTQFYPYWELCICDDASPAAHVAQILSEAAASDPRIRWTRRDENGHICAATNDALALASGEYVALMDHDDLLPPHALYSVSHALIEYPETEMLFTDEDRISDDGRRHTPHFKPGWNPELLLAQNFVSHLGVYRRKLLTRIGGLRLGFEGSQDYDLALRVFAEVGQDRIRHLPGIFYHWRLTETEANLSFSQSQLDRCIDAARRAITEFLGKRHDTHGAGAYVGPALVVPSWSRVRWPLPQPLPKVSIIIPTRDHHELLAQSAQGVLYRTEYLNIELIIADNDSTDERTFALFEKLRTDPRVQILSCPGPFNYSAINNRAVRASSGEVIVLLNNDIDVIGSGWLGELVSIAARPEVGAVGAKLLYADGTVQHGGVALGIGQFNNGPGVAGHFGFGENRSDIGYFGQNILSRDLSAVTAACIAFRRDVFEIIGGLDENNLAVAFNDVDFCLRIRSAGFRIIWTPYAELYHLESASRGSDEAPEKVERFRRECQYMRDRWASTLDNDPFYNPVFSRLGPLFSPTRPSRPSSPWRGKT